MSFDPEGLNYSGLGAKGLKRSDFTKEQLADSGIETDFIFSKVPYEVFFSTKLRVILSISVLVLTIVLIVLVNIFKSSIVVQVFSLLIVPLMAIDFVVFFSLMVKLMMRARLRLLKFAIDNGLVYRGAGVPVPTEPIMFNTGHDRKVTDNVSFPDGTVLASYNYTIGSGKNKQTIVINFARVKLPRAVPHIYLNGIRNLIGATVSEYEVQELSLEGDFNKYFVLYTPPDYHIDALQLFTPDVMVALKDVGTSYDYELVDEYMYVYAPNNTMASTEGLKKLLNAVVAVSSQFAKQTATYSDARAGDIASGSVALQGKRLVRRKWTWAAVLPIIFGAGWFFIIANDAYYQEGNSSSRVLFLLVVVFIFVGFAWVSAIIKRKGK